MKRIQKVGENVVLKTYLFTTLKIVPAVMLFVDVVYNYKVDRLRELKF